MMVLEAKKFIGDSLTCPSRVLHLPGMCHMLLVYCSIDYINLCKGCVPKKLLKETLVHLSPRSESSIVSDTCRARETITNLFLGLKNPRFDSKIIKIGQETPEIQYFELF